MPVFIFLAILIVVVWKIVGEKIQIARAESYYERAREEKKRLNLPPMGLSFTMLKEYTKDGMPWDGKTWGYWYNNQWYGGTFEAKNQFDAINIHNQTAKMFPERYL